MRSHFLRSCYVLVVGFALVFVASTAPPAVAKLPTSGPEDVRMNAAMLRQIDRVVADALAAKKMPGCVVTIGRRGKIVLLKAYGDKQVQPERVAMTTDTVFDLASLTKPIATATSVMILVERGKVKLEGPVAKYVPEFGQHGKAEITALQLLTHQGGLIPDNSLDDYADGPEKAWQRIFALKPFVEPGSKFVYTDVGYLVLGELVHRVSGKNVHEFARENIYQPLGMNETGFLPKEDLRQRAAPTEQRNDKWMRGEVHDPRAYRLGGIAGHAGLFSTASDLAVYAQMMLGGGRYGDARILAQQTVAEMTRPRPVSSGFRGLGWDSRTGYSSNRGRTFSSRAFGHGGFTGTTIWIDPQLELFVIFLSNRVHPDGQGAVNPLAGRIGTIAANSIIDSQRKSVLTGIDVLQLDGFRPLAGRRVGLIANQTSVSRHGVATARLLHEAPDVTLVALFSPEHGLQGQLDQSNIPDSRDESLGLPVYSLYGQTRKPMPETLKEIDTLVFDIQDIGARFYTYISTMGYAMQAAAEQEMRFVVLDRPNPIGGVEVEGPLLDAGRESFVGFHRLPVRHGMTAGELAKMFNADLDLGLDLQVVRVKGWRRSDLYDATGLMWINPSPNMRSLTEAVLYPGIGLLETTNLSVGRGTDTPFEWIGAPWLDGARLAQALNDAGLPGVRFVPVELTPRASKYQDQRCGGINVIITSRDVYRSVRTGLEIAHQLHALYPDMWQARAWDRLLGNKRALEALLLGQTALQIESLGQDELQEFIKRRSRYLLYE